MHVHAHQNGWALYACVLKKRKTISDLATGSGNIAEPLPTDYNMKLSEQLYPTPAGSPRVFAYSNVWFCLIVRACSSYCCSCVWLRRSCMVAPF